MGCKYNVHTNKGLYIFWTISKEKGHCVLQFLMKIEVFCFSSLTLSAVQDAELPQTKASKVAKGQAKTLQMQTNYKQITVKTTDKLRKYTLFAC